MEKAEKVKMFPLTDGEKKYLQENAAEMTIKVLTVSIQHLSPRPRNEESIRYYCKRLGVRAKSDGRHTWTEAEENKLMPLYKRHGLRKTARLMGLSEKSIQAKVIQRKKAIRRKQHTPWMASMLDIIEDAGKSIYDLSLELHFQKGKRVEIVENDEGQLALLTIERG
jgi:hypothetical protein